MLSGDYIIKARFCEYTCSTTVPLTLWRSRIRKEIPQTLLRYSLVVESLFGVRKLPKLMTNHVLRDEHGYIVLPIVYQETDAIPTFHQSVLSKECTTRLPYKVGQNSARSGLCFDWHMIR